MRVVAGLFLLMTFITANVLAADAPYVGKWKLNPAKSDFGESTATYEPMAGGQMKMTAAGQSYTFKTDGKDYPTPGGTVSAWNSPSMETSAITTASILLCTSIPAIR